MPLLLGLGEYGSESYQALLWTAKTLMLSNVEITVQPDLILLKCFQCIMLPHKLHLLMVIITEVQRNSISLYVDMLG